MHQIDEGNRRSAEYTTRKPAYFDQGLLIQIVVTWLGLDIGSASLHGSLLGARAIGANRHAKVV
jgi:hypothetical protein